MSKSDQILQKLSVIERKLDILLGKADNTKSHQTSEIKCEGGDIIIHAHPDFLLITGHTFDIRSVLKKWKSKWEPSEKGWLINRKYVDYDSVKLKLKQCCSSVNIKVCANMYKSDSGSDTKTVPSNAYNASPQCDIETSDDD